jgi:hypothetical protein
MVPVDYSTSSSIVASTYLREPIGPVLDLHLLLTTQMHAATSRTRTSLSGYFEPSAFCPAPADPTFSLWGIRFNDVVE